MRGIGEGGGAIDKREGFNHGSEPEMLLIRLSHRLWGRLRFLLSRRSAGGKEWSAIEARGIEDGIEEVARVKREFRGEKREEAERVKAARPPRVKVPRAPRGMSGGVNGVD